ncbi:FAD dependent oxidoreductase [Punctularia strigosozonata HHB-11173 SS5]|uniref:FAD dependent oxidoreductase n=1 Tax=Punctularia strigosozonata (strain HHB-11173) TaxID=741275 RepID=UPI000441700F|nr:FAD dependent oxidoreductase [Punctularia strigosozonata HHB-11173 SS5]EIN09729.1 FAD dependent oxidoreductase [Punctularia strigosozonata HHB-11173 SS5]
MAAISKESKILIVGGGGVMGSSTALHLARRGYTDIHVIDVWPIPSQRSAGYDLNKIASSGQYSNPFHAELSKQAIHAWANDETFKPYYHNTGTVSVSAASKFARSVGVKRTYDRLVEEKWPGVEWLDNKDDFVRHVPQLKDAHIEGWKGIWNPEGGWVAARDALNSVGRELHERGVTFTSGPAGTFKEPIVSEDGVTIIGALAEDGTKHYADHVVLATGAWTPSLIDLKGQCLSKCWVLCHIKLSDEEAAEYKGCPVVYNGDLGFFFEPSRDNLIKVCDEFPGFTHYEENVKPFGASKPSRISVPRSHAEHPTDTVPDESVKTMSKVIQSMLPRFTDRPQLDQKMCWCTDTADRYWLITPYPGYKNLTIASGDSGHCFSFLPVVGKWIADLLEGKLDEELAQKWRWRPGVGDPSHSDGREETSKDINELPGWKHENSNLSCAVM